MRRIRLVVLLLIAAVIGAGGMIARDYFHRKRLFQERTACVGTLLRLEMSKAIYANEHGLTNGTVIPDEIVWRENGITEHCLSGGSYSINPVDMYPTCSYTGVVKWKGQEWRHEWWVLSRGLTNRWTE